MIMIKMTPPKGTGEIEVPKYKVQEMENIGWKQSDVVTKVKTAIKKGDMTDGKS